MYSRKPGFRWRSQAGAALLIAALFAGAAFRFYRLDWTEGDTPHPDENLLVMVFMSLTPSQLDPHFYNYGTLPLYLMRLTQAACSFLAARGWSFLPLNPWAAGRIVSALSGSLTVLLVFLLGRRLFNSRTGLLAAWLLALTPLHIKHSHFLTVDIFITFLLTATLYFAAGIMTRRRLRDHAWTGLAWGLALATKISALPAAAPILAAHWFGRRQDGGFSKAGNWRRLALLAAIAGTAGAAAQPYVFINFAEACKAVFSQTEMVRGGETPWYLLHYVSTAPVLYQVKHFLLWTAGAPLGILSLLAMVWTLAAGIRRRDPRYLFLHSFAVPYFFIVFVMAKVKFLRYQLPLLPLFAIFIAAAALELIPRCRRQAARHAITAVLAGVLLSSLLYDLALTGLYRQPNARRNAIAWMAANAPRGSRLLVCTLDMSLPLNMIPGFRPDYYQFQQLEIFTEPESPQAMAAFCGKLAWADFIVLPNPSQYNLILSDAERRPLVASYFRNLFAGRLGFSPAPSFAVYPSLGPFELNTALADVDFYFYDHPKVQIFRKAGSLPIAELAARIGAPDAAASAMTREKILRFRVRG